MTDTADLVKELREAAIQRAEIAGDFNDAGASWEAHLFSQAATALEATQARAEAAEKVADDLGEMARQFADELIAAEASLAQANERVAAAERRAAAYREALEEIAGNCISPGTVASRVLAKE